jgi:MFS family permease
MDKQGKDGRRGTAIRQWFSHASSKVGLSGLPFQIYVMLIVSLLFSLGRNIAFPYLAMFLTGSSKNGGLEFEPSFVGFMIMVGGFSYILALLVTGSLCDRFGRRKMMLVSLIPQAILTAGYAYAQTYVQFMLIYVATGIVGAFYDPAYSAMIADLIEPAKREEVYGLSYMISNVGTIVGPLIGGMVASVNGYPVLFVCAAFFAAVSVGIFAPLIKETSPREVYKTSLSQFAGIFKDKVFILFCFVGAMTNLVYTQLYGLLSVFTEYVGFKPYIFGILLSVNGAMVVALQIPIRKGTMKLGATKTFIVAQLFYAAGFTYFMVASSFMEFLAGIVVLTLGEIMFVPAISGFTANLAPADMRGRYMATLGLFFSIGGSAGSQIAFSIFGILSDKRLIWGILGTVGFATLLGYGLLLKVTTKKQKKTSCSS